MKTITCTVFLLLLVSCQKKVDKNYEKLEKMNWLVGNWEQKLPEGLVSESWTKENDSTFSGRSYYIKGKDTLHLESITLTQNQEDLLYTPTVSGQNNDKPVTFKLTSAIENTFSFENPTHDYPQKITYKKINDTNLLATISGKQLGKVSQESYPMKKK